MDVCLLVLIRYPPDHYLGPQDCLVQHANNFHCIYTVHECLISSASLRSITLLVTWVTQHKKATTHQLTTMLSTSKYVPFPGQRPAHHRCWGPNTLFITQAPAIMSSVKDLWARSIHPHIFVYYCYGASPCHSPLYCWKRECHRDWSQLIQCINKRKL